MRARSLRALWPLALLAALVAVPAFADPCDNDKTADRVMLEAQRKAERAQHIAEQIARQAQHQAEMAAARAEWAADHASGQDQREAERVQAQAEQAAARAQRDAERLAREAERAAERAAIGAPGVVVTNDGVLYVDGPQVPWDQVEWVDEARARRMREPVTTDTTLPVSPGITLSLRNLSGDIVVRVGNRSEVRVSAVHDRRDQLVAAIQDRRLRLGVRSPDGPPADVDWNITVPAWLPLEIKGIESEIAVTGMRAPVVAQSMRGDVHVSSCQGPMELNSLEGEVHAEDVSGNVTASSVNSVVRMVRVKGPIEAQSINGDIQMDDVSSADVSASTLNGVVYYASKYQEKGRYAFSSHNGKLYVGVDKTQPINVTVSSFNGQVESSVAPIPVPPTAPSAPAPPSPPAAMVWRKWKWSWPAEAASATAPPAPASGSPRPRSSRTMTFTPRPETPYAPELELESFGGLIQLASSSDIERMVQLRQAMRDSAEAVRRLARLRAIGRMHMHDRTAPEARTDEDPDKDPDKH